MSAEPDGLDEWLEEARRASRLRVERVPFAECHGWRYEGGQLVHESGRFFGVKGLAPSPDNGGAAAVMIDQPEVGWLGFMVRKNAAGNGVEWLLQAKTEPGNVGGTQIAPSVQATRSNYMRAHGGAATRFIDLFREGRAFLSDAPNSEQGTRFLWKFNRNSVLAIPREASPESDAGWRWCGAGDLRAALGTDYTVNTDARSVIATAPWALLGEGGPLFRSRALQSSYQERVGGDRLLVFVWGLTTRRVTDWRFASLHELPGWSMTDAALVDASGEETLACYAVAVADREVDAWRQPLLVQRREDACTLLLRVVDGAAQVFVRAYQELGFGGRSEFGPTLHSSFATPPPLAAMAKSATPLVSIDQSDEGGRFMAVRCRYAVVLITDSSGQSVFPFGRWVSLAILEELTRRPGTTTNELRTLASLVLSRAFDEACLGL